MSDGNPNIRESKRYKGAAVVNADHQLLLKANRALFAAIRNDDAEGITREKCKVALAQYYIGIVSPPPVIS